ncbi:MAG TPA: dienelactone hydrolase family protein [bacterium]|nr:dienelactone hydrolase family protein [bacterium]
MRPLRDSRDRLGRRQLLRALLRGGERIGLTTAFLFGVRALGGGVRVSPGPARAVAAPAQPATPPRPGAPPDKEAASGVTVNPDDPAITAAMVQYPGVTGPLLGYLSGPRAADIYPGLLLIHDSQGLTEHFKDIARRLAKAGYVALAADLTSRSGGVDKLVEPAKITAALQAIGPPQILQDLNSAVRYLEARPFVAKSRVGVIGIGVGGNLIWLLLTSNPDVRSAVAISGAVPSPRVVSTMSAGVLEIYGENERRDEAGITQFDTAMKKAGLPFTVKLEPKAGPNFFDDTNPRYVPDAAKDAWGMTLDWFSKHLAG